VSEDSEQRLHKVLAHAGVASRRKAEEMIRQGRVSVNRQVVTELGTKVDPRRDRIEVDGQRIRIEAGHHYLLLNKPRGILSTMEDSRGRTALGDLVAAPVRLYPVGRLDADSSGLVLLTDDGELADLLTHPRYGHDKEYHVLVQGVPPEKVLGSWRRGVVLDGQPTAPARVEVLTTEKGAALLRVVMHEGRKRQIRRVATLLGYPVQELKRVRLGPLQLGGLEPGQWRYLTAKEISALEALKRQAEVATRPKPGRRVRKR